MAYTREQLQKMLTDLDEQENVDEVIVEENGRKYHVRGRRATTLLDALFGDGDQGDGAGGPEGEGEEGGDDTPPGDDKPPRTSVWGKR
jgi:hypothetical protein